MPENAECSKVPQNMVGMCTVTGSMNMIAETAQSTTLNTIGFHAIATVSSRNSQLIAVSMGDSARQTITHSVM